MTQIQNVSSALMVIMNREDVLTSDEDDEFVFYVQKTRQKHTKIQEYVEKVVFNYIPDDFKTHFRMSRVAVEKLCIELQFRKDTAPGRPRLKPLSAVLLTLWTLATQETYREVSDRFGLSKGNTHTIFIEVCKLITRLNYIKFPVGNTLQQSVEGFNNLREVTFPNVVGCIDGSHIEIKNSTVDNSFYNRKGYTSVILQGIVNSNYEFIDVFCGYPGSAHDARVWQNSPIYCRIVDQRILPIDCHLLGDSAYPLNINLMVPFRDNGHLSRQQKRYNEVLSSHRVVIEQSFGRLYEVFRRLKYLNVLNLSNCKYIIIAACMLHNYIIQQKECEHFDIIDGPFNNALQEQAEILPLPRVNREARLKRERIMLLFDD